MRFKGIFSAILANISAVLSEILLISSAAWLIASAALHPPLSSLSIGITLVRTAGILRAILRYLDRFLSHRIIFRFLDDLRVKIYRKAAKIFPLKSGRSHEGEILHALTISADLMKDFLPRVVFPLITASVVTILLTFLLREPILPMIFVVNLIIAAKIEPKTADDSEYREKILDFCDGRDELKVFGTKPAIKSLDDAAKSFGADEFRLTKRQINLDTALKILNVAGFFYLLLKISADVDTIALTVWSLTFLALFELFSRLPIAVRTWKKIRELGKEGNREKENSTSQLPYFPVSLKNYAVEIKNLSFGYGNDKIFDDFSLKIALGEKIALVGESGAGKTTLLYLLTGLFTPDSGKIALGGKISASTFTNYIFSASIRENFLILHENITDEEIFSALKLVGLENFDINSPLGEDGANLSGGERNRLQIALAIANDAEILIFDEPTAGLDKNSAEKLVKNLISATKNRTLIIITHDSNYFADLGRIEIKK